MYKDIPTFKLCFDFHMKKLHHFLAINRLFVFSEGCYVKFFKDIKQTMPGRGILKLIRPSANLDTDPMRKLHLPGFRCGADLSE